MSLADHWPNYQSHPREICIEFHKLSQDRRPQTARLKKWKYIDVHVNFSHYIILQESKNIIIHISLLLFFSCALLPHLDKEAVSQKALGECWSILGCQTSEVSRCTAAQRHALLDPGLPLFGSFLVSFLFKYIRSQSYDGFISFRWIFGAVTFEKFLFSLLNVW